jgi:hypothetical protein
MPNIWGAPKQSGPTGDRLRDVLQLHLLRHLGEPQSAFHDEAGWSGNSREPGPPIDILIVPPEGERRFAYVVSCGCAIDPVTADPTVGRAERRVEFVLAAPQRGDDKADRNMLNLAANLVRQFAKLVHVQPVRMAAGETVAFAAEPQAVFEGSLQVAFAFLEPRLPSPGFEYMRLDGTETVHFLAPAPIYREELDLSRDQGPEALATALTAGGVTEMLDFSRASVVQPRRKGLFGRLATLFRSRPKA